MSDQKQIPLSASITDGLPADMDLLGRGSFTQGRMWKGSEGAEYFAFTRELASGKHVAAVQVNKGGQMSPLLLLYAQGYPTASEALDAGREVLEAYFGLLWVGT